MSTNPCDPSVCPGGNCIGCSNGQLNCNDPRCYPNCKNCNTKTSSSNWIIVTIILVLLGVLLVMAFIVGFDLYKKGKKAAEPKKITVNKHIHTVKQAPIVVSSPPPIVISQRSDPVPIQSQQSFSYQPSEFIPKREVGYEGINLSMEGIPSKMSSSSFVGARETPCDRR
jgi:hypothetical protein